MEILDYSAILKTEFIIKYCMSARYRYLTETMLYILEVDINVQFIV